MLHLSPRCSTSSPSYSSSSCSSVHARTSARLRRGSLTVTSKGTCLPLFFAMRLSLPSFSYLVPLPANFRIHVRIRLSCFPGAPTIIRTRILGIFFMSARIGESRRRSYTQTSLLTETRVSTSCRRTVITLCSIGVHRNGRTHDTLMTFSPLYIH